MWSSCWGLSRGACAGVSFVVLGVCGMDLGFGAFGVLAVEFKVSVQNRQ